MNTARMLVLAATIAATLTTATAASAHECEVDLHYGITLEAKQVLLNDDDSVFSLSDGELHRDGKSVALSAAEKQQLRQYEAGLRELVPQVSAVTREALAIAGEATDFAFSTLLGPEHESVKQLRGKFANLGTEIGKRIDDRHLPMQAMSLRDDDWDVVGDGASISWNVAEVGFAIVGKAMRAAFDDDYAAKWEADLDRMEKELDARVETRAKALEAKAEGLCDNLTELEKLETSLSHSNKALAGFDVVRQQAH